MQLDVAELDRMRDSVFFDGPALSRRLSRFWILLVLAAVIAAAGVVADSTATVIGAMIVAPLMTPIQGTMLAVVIADRGNLTRSMLLVIAGAAAAMAIGFVVGVVVPNDVVAATNSQVAGRVSPRLIDLLAAAATGVVGSIALIRRDIADTLPGVAIAISLVPPLTVVGLTLESGEPHQSLGALLLFVTNVAAILATGAIVMALFGVQRLVVPPLSPDERAVNRRKALVAIAVMVVVVGIPLTVSSVRVAVQTANENKAFEASDEWAQANDWEVLNVTTQEGRTVIRMAGPLPIPPTDSLRDELEEHGVDPGDVEYELVPIEKVTFDDNG
jgi:uncharacterized hydrophobic protein (TIGR00271 family)